MASIRLADQAGACGCSECGHGVDGGVGIHTDGDFVVWCDDRLRDGPFPSLDVVGPGNACSLGQFCNGARPEDSRHAAFYQATIPTVTGSTSSVPEQQWADPRKDIREGYAFHESRR